MPEFYKKQKFLYPIYALTLLTLLLVTVLVYYNWIFGVATSFLFCLIVLVLIKFELAFRKNLEQYTSDMITRVKKVSDEALNQMPIGILLYNKEYGIDWANPYLTSCFGHQTLI
jgi:c-di-AMP phosphodiesterase-like protein